MSRIVPVYTEFEKCEYCLDRNNQAYADMVRNLVHNGYEYDSSLSGYYLLTEAYNKRPKSDDVSWKIYVNQMLQRDCGTDMIPSLSDHGFFDQPYNEKLSIEWEYQRVVHGRQLRFKPIEVKASVTHDVDELRRDSRCNEIADVMTRYSF